MPQKIQTKFGIASKRTDDYWHITSTKEGNFNKLLHRLVFEDFYNINLDNDTILHHEDGDKDNNEIWNLVPMTQSEHIAFHNRKYNPINYVKDDINFWLNRSRKMNSTNVFRVYVNRDKGYKQGFTYCYKCKGEDGKMVYIRSVDINKLKEKVLARGFEWIVLDETKPIGYMGE